MIQLKARVKCYDQWHHVLFLPEDEKIVFREHALAEVKREATLFEMHGKSNCGCAKVLTHLRNRHWRKLTASPIKGHFEQFVEPLSLDENYRYFARVQRRLQQRRQPVKIQAVQGPTDFAMAMQTELERRNFLVTDSSRISGRMLCVIPRLTAHQPKPIMQIDIRNPKGFGLPIEHTIDLPYQSKADLVTQSHTVLLNSESGAYSSVMRLANLAETAALMAYAGTNRMFLPPPWHMDNIVTQGGPNTDHWVMGVVGSKEPFIAVHVDTVPYPGSHLFRTMYCQETAALIGRLQRLLAAANKYHQLRQKAETDYADRRRAAHGNRPGKA